MSGPKLPLIPILAVIAVSLIGLIMLGVAVVGAWIVNAVPTPVPTRLAAQASPLPSLAAGFTQTSEALNPVPSPTSQPTIEATARSTVETAVLEPTLQVTSESTSAPSAEPILDHSPTPTLLTVFVVQAPTFPPTALPPTESPPEPTLPPVYVIVTSAPSSTPDSCPHPEGWVAYRIEPGDTLFGFQLASENQVSVKTIQEGNCLNSNLLQIGQVVFLPPGIGEKAPKIDESAAVGGDPDNPTRSGSCPCYIRVREGWRLEQIAAAIDNVPASFTGRDFLAATGPGASAPDYWFLHSRPAGRSLEGFMYPGSYTLENGMSAVMLRDQMLARFAEQVGQDLEGAFAARGLTFWQGVNLASIVQRESYAPNEQVMIAGVMYNRMANGMGLASFVTLQYALGVSGNWWPRINASNINTDTPYHTSKYKGLPPSPISNPGINALRSTAYPASHDYFFFNFKCEGGGNFYARTYEEFKQGLKCD